MSFEILMTPMSLRKLSPSNRQNPFILGFCSSNSGSGKTTLIEKIIPILINKKLVVSVIKHAHHNFDIDIPGKDSYRLRKSGSYQTLVLNQDRAALITESPQANINVLQMIKQMDQNVDMILIEGLKNLPYKKIEVFRKGISNEKLYLNDKSIIALATDDNDNESIPKLNINSPDQVCDFILKLIIRP